MPLWGIVLLGLGAWVLISVVLGVIIGRAVKVADAHRRDQEFVRQLSRRPAPVVRTPHDDAWPRPAVGVPSVTPIAETARPAIPAPVASTLPGLAHR
jgi:hypothetical protein